MYSSSQYLGDAKGIRIYDKSKRRFACANRQLDRLNVEMPGDSRQLESAAFHAACLASLQLAGCSCIGNWCGKGGHFSAAERDSTYLLIWNSGRGSIVALNNAYLENIAKDCTKRNRKEFEIPMVPLALTNTMGTSSIPKRFFDQVEYVIDWTHLGYYIMLGRCQSYVFYSNKQTGGKIWLNTKS
ncbi:MAG: hypothetical protein VX869_06540 [Chloroflexota bacterium]|nr:hypothetical protein [Chloroflexota bacterium]